MASGVENDLDNFIFDPTEISLQDYLDEWKSKAQGLKIAAPHISDGKLGFKLLKSLDFPKRKVDFILEHINVDECIKQGIFVNQLLTVISTLSSQDWKSSCNNAKPRFEITDDGARSVNILEDSHFVFLEHMMNYLGFEDKKNLCLVSKRMYLRTNKFAPEIATLRLKLTDANYRTLKKTEHRFEVAEDANRTRNVLDDSKIEYFKQILTYVGFEDKKNLLLVSKRVYNRMIESEADFKTWKIKLTDTNYNYYLSKLKTTPYAEAQKEIDLDVTEYSGSAKRLVPLVKDRVTSISGLNIKIVTSFLKTEGTLENIKSLSFKGITPDDKVAMITFLDCCEITPRQLMFINCDIDRKVMELGFETFYCLEDLVVHEDKMKSTSLRILLRKSSKTLKSLKLGFPKFKAFNVLVLKDLKFPNLNTVALDLKNSPVSCHELFRCLSVNAKSLEVLKVVNVENLPQSSVSDIHFPALKCFNYVSVLEHFVDPLVKFPYCMPILTKLELNGLNISTQYLHRVLDSCQHLQDLTIGNIILCGDLLLPTTTSNKLKSLLLNSILKVSSSTVWSSFEHLSRQHPDLFHKDVMVKYVLGGNTAPLINLLIQSSSNTLQHLELNDIDFDGIELHSNISNLRQLNVRMESFLSEESATRSLFRLLSKCYKTLEKLVLVDYKKLDMIHLTKNIGTFPNLKVIILKDCQKVLNLSKFCNSAAQSLEKLHLVNSHVSDLGQVRLPKLSDLNLTTNRVGDFTDNMVVDITNLLSFCSSSLQSLTLIGVGRVPTELKKKFPKLRDVALLHGNPSILLTRCSTSLKCLTLPNSRAYWKYIPWNLLNLSYLNIYTIPSPEDISFLRRHVSSDCLIDSNVKRIRLKYIQHFGKRTYLT